MSEEIKSTATEVSSPAIIQFPPIEAYGSSEMHGSDRQRSIDVVALQPEQQVDVRGLGDITFEGLPFDSDPHRYHPQTFKLLDGRTVVGVPLLRFQSESARGAAYDTDMYLLDVRMMPKSGVSRTYHYDVDGTPMPDSTWPRFVGDQDTLPDYALLRISRDTGEGPYNSHSIGLSTAPGTEHGQHLGDDSYLYVSEAGKWTFHQSEPGRTVISRLPLEEHPAEDYWNMTQTLPPIDARNVGSDKAA